MKLGPGLIAALDIGTTKTCCLVARVGDDGVPHVVGIGHQMSRGIKSGAVVDMEGAELSILHAVHTAEQMAGETVRSVVVNLSCGQPTSARFEVELAVAGHEIGDQDIRRIYDKSQTHIDIGDRELIHSIPVTFRIDETSGIKDPRGMFGDSLGVVMHVVAANLAPVRNLATCVERSHLDIDRLVVSPYASGLAVLAEDEMDLGVTLVDMGGGTTSIAVFIHGNLVHADSVPAGGLHVTSDIARGLTTSMAAAERIKTLYGTTSVGVSDDQHMIAVPPLGDDDPTENQEVSRSTLTRIIRPRVEETFELVRGALEVSGFDRIGGRRVVLAGGASQLNGVRELAALVLDKQVRVGKPRRVAGLAESMSGPAFATAAGLIQYAARQKDEVFWTGIETAHDGTGLFQRLGHWLRENF